MKQGQVSCFSIADDSTVGMAVRGRAPSGESGMLVFWLHHCSWDLGEMLGNVSILLGVIKGLPWVKGCHLLMRTVRRVWSVHCFQRLSSVSFWVLPYEWNAVVLSLPLLQKIHFLFLFFLSGQKALRKSAGKKNLGSMLRRFTYKEKVLCRTSVLKKIFSASSLSYDFCVAWSKSVFITVEKTGTELTNWSLQGLCINKSTTQKLTFCCAEVSSKKLHWHVLRSTC